MAAAVNVERTASIVITAVVLALGAFVVCVILGAAFIVLRAAGLA